MHPHRKRYWLTPPPNDPADLAEQICTVCEIYETTPALAAAGAHVTSTDEMTGIQALELLHCLSVQELRMRILAFIAYDNRTSNGAFHWTYKGPSARS